MNRDQVGYMDAWGQSIALNHLRHRVSPELASHVGMTAGEWRHAVHLDACFPTFSCSSSSPSKRRPYREANMIRMRLKASYRVMTSCVSCAGASLRLQSRGCLDDTLTRALLAVKKSRSLWRDASGSRLRACRPCCATILLVLHKCLAVV